MSIPGGGHDQGVNRHRTHARGDSGWADAGGPRLVTTSADVVVVNGKVVTVDAASTIVEAAAIRDGRFVAVGTSADIRRLVGAGTRVIDATGRTVIPGLIDSHVHALGVAAAEEAQPFQNLKSIAEVQAWIRQAASTAPAGEWIWTPRVFPTRIREQRFPTRAELDDAAPRHPVVVDGAYALMVNSAALQAASIDGTTAESAGRGDRQGPRGPSDRAAAQCGRPCSPGSGRRRVGAVAGRAGAGPCGVHRVGITSIGERARQRRGISDLRGAAQGQPPPRARDGDDAHSERTETRRASRRSSASCRWRRAPATSG